MDKNVLLYDTTLRDGGQGEKINFAPEDKIKIAKKLDEKKINYIEGGYPGSNIKDVEFFEAMKTVKLKHVKLVAFGSTRKPKTKTEEDKNLQAILKSGCDVACFYATARKRQIKLIRNNNLSENLTMIIETGIFLKTNGIEEIHFDAEHFFQGFKENKEFALATIQAAIDGLADYIVLCDTNGDCMPHEVFNIVKTIKKHFPDIKLGIHAHNDSDVAVANSLEAIRAGVEIVQGTINGYGERCGNANLISIIPNLVLKMNYSCSFNLTGLKELGLYIGECANRSPYEAAAYVGDSAFAHKGGRHVYFVKKDPSTYEHINPSLVGNKRRILISEVSGTSNIELKAKELGLNLDKDQAIKLLSEIKKQEKRGLDLEAADASFALLAEKIINGNKYKPPFKLKHFRVTIVKEGDNPCYSEATICIEIDGEDIFRGAKGKGPVDALKKALLKTIGKKRQLDFIRLMNFKVRVVNGYIGTDAQVKVSMAFGDSKNTWNSIGVSEDIIEACWQAISDATAYKLTNL